MRRQEQLDGRDPGDLVFSPDTLSIDPADFFAIFSAQSPACSAMVHTCVFSNDHVVWAPQPGPKRCFAGHAGGLCSAFVLLFALAQLTWFLLISFAVMRLHHHVQQPGAKHLSQERQGSRDPADFGLLFPHSFMRRVKQWSRWLGTAAWSKRCFAGDAGWF